MYNNEMHFIQIYRMQKRKIQNSEYVKLFHRARINGNILLHKNKQLFFSFFNGKYET